MAGIRTSFSFLAAKLWNLLLTYARNAKDISTFKCLRSKFLDRLRMVILNSNSTVFVARTCFNKFESLLDVAWVNKVF